MDTQTIEQQQQQARDTDNGAVIEKTIRGQSYELVDINTMICQGCAFTGTIGIGCTETGRMCLKYKNRVWVRKEEKV